ncbi:hypothetical protein SECTIM467_116 [Brevibacillus phage SecTim467]|uniref:Uncharacterized protein n=2 Tax=Jenstvirus jenst TaxID=1982225 RepID=A0A0K2CPQ6_9CAUD|nr:hypothetical protein AVV11_gp080 [Brevibacillus phage Jenst]ALA07240.1 hypothetical protein JENST_111 [Brevibacillus phage Jenst]ALA07564.1 hypothetical protein SECTIM467_116 [Brevibacillus phage SecTim467]
MIGFTNQCPHCGGKSSFTPEEMECDKSLVLWCNHCGNFLNQTLTLETLRRWWKRYELGEESIIPPVSKKNLTDLEIVEKMLNEESGWMKDIEIHIKDFRDYRYTSTEEGEKE